MKFLAYAPRKTPQKWQSRAGLGDSPRTILTELADRLQSVILLKNPKNASTVLSMNGKFPMISRAPPFVLRLSKDERRVFQQNRVLCRTPAMTPAINGVEIFG